MLIPNNITCKTCSKVFCCPKCRLKHEDKEHMDIRKIEQICYICNKKPFPLRLDLKVVDPKNLLMSHILKNHLPLCCNKCNKIFTEASDFEEITKCFNKQNDNICSLEKANIESENKENTPGLKISKELKAITDPRHKIEQISEDMLTPLTKFNLKWKRKSRSLTDSMVSMPNLSAVHSSASNPITASPKKKLVRTTSTPVVNLTHLKPNELSCQVSSIYSNSHRESDSSGNSTPTSPLKEELQKVKAIIRSRPKIAATPLRQVMSKSIHRAIAQHGYYTQDLAPGVQRKMTFDSTTSSGHGSAISMSPIQSPLDLRTTPVLKRTKSEPFAPGFFRKPLPRVQFSICESAESSQASVLTNTDYFETAKSFIQNTFEDRQMDMQNQQNAAQDHMITPRLSSEIMKKVISFETPNDVTKEVHEDKDDENDVWSTPMTMLTKSYSCSVVESSYKYCSDSLLTEDENSYFSSDDVFKSPVKSNFAQNKTKNRSRLWSIVSNVIKLASGSDIVEENEYKEPRAPSLVKRAASFAGYLKKQYYSKDNIEEPNVKRRRCSSISVQPSNSDVFKSPSVKRKRIQGRQPIDRMKERKLLK